MNCKRYFYEEAAAAAAAAGGGVLVLRRLVTGETGHGGETTRLVVGVGARERDEGAGVVSKEGPATCWTPAEIHPDAPVAEIFDGGVGGTRARDDEG